MSAWSGRHSGREAPGQAIYPAVGKNSKMTTWGPNRGRTPRDGEERVTNMKQLKKALALMLALTVVFAYSAVGAFAADGYTVTINQNTQDKGTHTYGAYQIFAGDLDATSGKLSNIVWGSGITDAGKTALGDAETYAKALTDANAAAKAEELAKYLASPEKTGSDKIEGLVGGYYLIQDTAAPTGNKPSAKTKFILKVVKNTTANVKSSVPSVDKEIAETTPTKVSDYDIGDDIPYTITGTLPEGFDGYKTYKTFTFTDTMSAGLTPPKASEVTVKIGNDDITSLFDVDVTGQVLTVSLKDGVDLKTAKHGSGDGTAFAGGDEIVVSYSAKLNDSAVIGGTGNANTVTLTFSNNPNSGGDGETGTTPEDKTVVFTYTIKALKVKATDDAAISADAYNALSAEEKANYVKVGDEYQKVEPLTGAEFTLYKDSKTDANKVATLTTGSTFEFKGVDAGKYILSETKTPSGYNTIADITINVTATYDNSTKPATLTSLTCTPSDFIATASTGVVEGKILNQQGSELPETGGIGTTIFYILGAILVLGAGVLLITRRRMQAR